MARRCYVGGTLDSRVPSPWMAMLMIQSTPNPSLSMPNQSPQWDRASGSMILAASLGVFKNPWISPLSAPLSVFAMAVPQVYSMDSGVSAAMRFDSLAIGPSRRKSAAQVHLRRPSDRARAVSRKLILGLRIVPLAFSSCSHHLDTQEFCPTTRGNVSPHPNPPHARLRR